MLTTQQILSASLNDIVFQDRNKGYGAYLLRREYTNHLKVALGAMLMLCMAAFVFYFMGPLSSHSKTEKAYNPETVTLFQPPPPNIPVPPPPPPPPPAVQQAILTEVFTPPVIVNEEISPEDMPPEQDALDRSKIGLVKIEGVEIGSIVAPPVETKGLGGVIAPKVTEHHDTKVWTKVENPAEFPGGQGEWTRYLQQNLRYPEVALDNNTQAVVRVQFIVDKEGNISEVMALNDPGDGLAEEAVRIIKKGPKWRPAEQNGSKVIYRNIQAITFRIN
jgi:protein TonB